MTTTTLEDAQAAALAAAEHAAHTAANGGGCGGGPQVVERFLSATNILAATAELYEPSEQPLSVGNSNRAAAFEGIGGGAAYGNESRRPLSNATGGGGDGDGGGGGGGVSDGAWGVPVNYAANSPIHNHIAIPTANAETVHQHHRQVGAAAVQQAGERQQRAQVLSTVTLVDSQQQQQQQQRQGSGVGGAGGGEWFQELSYPEDNGPKDNGREDGQQERGGGLRTSPMTSPQRTNSKSKQQQVATSGRESGYLRPLHAPKAPPAQGPNGRHTRSRSGGGATDQDDEGVGEQKQQQQEEEEEEEEEEFGREHYTEDDGNVAEDGEELEQGIMGFAATSGPPLISLTSPPTTDNHHHLRGGGGRERSSHASDKEQEVENFLNLDLESPTAVMQRASISGQQGGGLLHPGEPSGSVANDSLGGSLEVESWGGKK
jgi:hypothetical protein